MKQLEIATLDANLNSYVVNRTENGCLYEKFQESTETGS